MTELIRALGRRHPRASRWTRYTAASAIATVVSQLTFLVVYGAGLAGPRTASLVAIFAGVPPKFVLTRWWVWQREGTPTLRGEVLPYLLVVAVTGVVAGYVTDLAEELIRAHVDRYDVQVALVSSAFFATMAAAFVVRYVLFDRLVFADRSRT